MNSVITRAFAGALLRAACGLAIAACGLAVSAQNTAPPDPAPATVVRGSPTVVRGSPDPAPAPDPSRFEAEIAAFENWDRQNAFPRDAVLFVGSSSIRLWPTAESFPDLPVINRGFGGSHISDVNHFADRIVLKYNPQVIVFYAGDNDIADGKSPQRVFDEFKKFLRLVRDRLPKTRVLFLSIKPSLARQKVWPQMQEANVLVANSWRSHGRFIYIDIATPMLGADGQPRKELFLDDGLHLNAKGYELWTKILTPVLQRIRSPVVVHAK